MTYSRPVSSLGCSDVSAFNALLGHIDEPPTPNRGSLSVMSNNMSLTGRFRFPFGGCANPVQGSALEQGGDRGGHPRATRCQFLSVLECAGA